MKSLLRVFLGVTLLAAMGNSSAMAGNPAGLSSPNPNSTDYLFGFSSYDSNETLTVTLAGGSTAVLSTNGFQGWVSPNAFNTAGPDGNTNYIVGQFGTGPGSEFFNDYFVFNSSSLAGLTATGATLSVTQFQGFSDTGNTTETWRLGSVSAPAAALYDATSPDPALYSALASGSYYGGGVLPADGIISSNTVSFTLNGNAVGDINAAIAGADGGNFKIGGSLVGISPVPGALEFLLVRHRRPWSDRLQPAAPPDEGAGRLIARCCPCRVCSTANCPGLQVRASRP